MPPFPPPTAGHQTLAEACHGILYEHATATAATATTANITGCRAVSAVYTQDILAELTEFQVKFAGFAVINTDAIRWMKNIHTLLQHRQTRLPLRRPIAPQDLPHLVLVRTRVHSDYPARHTTPHTSTRPTAAAQTRYRGLPTRVHTGYPVTCRASPKRLQTDLTNLRTIIPNLYTIPPLSLNFGPAANTCTRYK